MLNNFIGGGQVFLHKVRMFSQVFLKTLVWGLLIGKIIAVLFYWSAFKDTDWRGFLSYQKANIALSYDMAIRPIRNVIGKPEGYESLINVCSYDKNYVSIKPSMVINMYRFQEANEFGWLLIEKALMLAAIIAIITFFIIFILWSYFGKGLKTERRKSGGQILTAAEVRKTLKASGSASDITIGKMPLVKDMETRHFLVTGSTGSGKTNLIHNILPQLSDKKYPVVIIDQTGEMIAKYYNKERGDIIFNPFDARSHVWDFWKDTERREDLERFTKILFSFNRQKSGYNSDPFWEESAQTIFIDSVEYLRNLDQFSIENLVDMVRNSDLSYLRKVLAGTASSRYLAADNKTTASSILAVLSTTAKPLQYIQDITNNGAFSFKEHFANITTSNKNDVDKPWIFLATKPSARELTLPLISCLTNLALSQLMEIGVDDTKQRKIWFVIDELAALGRLPALSPLMAEGRKYGACVIAALQSLNQLYSNYGQYDGSVIFGQFGSNFFFRNNEEAIGKMFSSMCGMETITRHQKNTSFGANEFRDGVSYTEQEHKKNLVEYSDLASLAVGECYVLLPDPSVRLSKIQTPEVNIAAIQAGFKAIYDCNQTDNTECITKVLIEEDESITGYNRNTQLDNSINHKETHKQTEENIELENVNQNKGNCDNKLKL